jgi:chromosome segregation ATPase
MKRSIFPIIMICLLMTITLAVRAVAQSGHTSSSNSSSISHSTEDANLAAWVRQLSQEVKLLKLEVLKLQLELQQTKVAQLEHELQKTQAEKGKAETQEKELNHELAGLDERLSLPSLPPEEQAEISTIKAALLNQGPARLLAKQQQITQQEAELTDRLKQEQERLQVLKEKLAKLQNKGA